MDDHIRCDLGCTGLPEFRIAFHLYHTKSACAVNFCSLIIAKSRNENIVLFADIENGLAGKSIDFFSVDI